MEKRKRKQAERRRGGPEHISGPLAEVLRRYGIGKAESGESRAESQNSPRLQLQAEVFGELVNRCHGETTLAVGETD